MNVDSVDKVVRTTVWSPGPGCHGGCGVKLFIKDGKVVQVEGDENHPYSQGRVCPRVLALTQYMYHPDRLTKPLKRVGERGEGKWQEISWDEAYDTIETKLKDIREKHGAESVIFCQGTGRDIGGPISFLMYAYGSPNWTQLGLPGHACYTPRLAGMFATQGDYSVYDASQFLEQRYNDPEWRPPAVLINWGANPSIGCIDALFSHWIVDCMKKGTKIITIDPRVIWIASRSHIHLQLRPGTDGALALGILNVLINENLYDKDFVDQWTFGFEELKKRVQEYPPDKVAEITWVPAEKIIEAARLIGTSKPMAVNWSQPIDACPEGTTVCQAISQIWAITGNIDIPGGMVIARSSHGVSSYPYGAKEIVKIYGEELVARLNEKRIGADRYPLVKNFRGWAQPDMLTEQLETGKPYPIKAAWIQTTNTIGGQANDTRRHYNALRKLDFIVVVDLFHNPTTMALADIVLPAASFAEKQSIRSWWAPLSVVVKAVDVPECKSDWEINLELAKRLSLKPLPYETVEDIINSRLKGTGLTYQKLAEKGSWEMPPEGPTRPYRRWEKGLLRADGKAGFNTPTGKVELYSTFLEKCGIDPLPYYREPLESPVATPELYQKYPFILISGRRNPVYFHSELRQIPWLREIDPDPTVEIHPSKAKELSISAGEWVYLENDRGRVKAKARITPTIHPDCLSASHGWWLPETEGKEPNLFSTWDYNVNQLTKMGTQGSSGFGGSIFRCVLCKVSKIT